MSASDHLNRQQHAMREASQKSQADFDFDKTFAKYKEVHDIEDDMDVDEDEVVFWDAMNTQKGRDLDEYQPNHEGGEDAYLNDLDDVYGRHDY